MSTVPELVTETQGLLKKSAKTTAAVDDILRWFNELNRRLARKVKLPQIWSGPLESGVEEYKLPVEEFPLLRLRKAFYTPAGSTEGCPIGLLGLRNRFRTGIRFLPAPPGQPYHTIYVWPTTLNGTLEIHGDGSMAKLTNEATSIPEIPEDFHDLYPLFAAARFGGQDEDFGGDGRFANYMRDFLGREQELITEMSKGSNSGPRFVGRGGD